MSNMKGSIFGWAVVGICVGIYLFFTGFRKLWHKRLIQNIPTSKIRSIAMGLVEIQGIAIPDIILVSPYTKQQCVFYHIIMERLVKHKNSVNWVKEFEMKSNIPFFLQDDTGTVIIDPVGAEIDIPLRYTHMEGNNRYKEYYIKIKEPIYVLGTAKSIESIEEHIQKEVETRIKEIIESPEEKQKLDINKDMWIDENEWQIAKQRIMEEIKEKFRATQGKISSKNFPPDYLKNVIIGKGELDRHFFISNKSEKEIVGEYKYRVFLYIIGGAILTLLCLKIVISFIF